MKICASYQTLGLFQQISKRQRGIQVDGGFLCCNVVLSLRGHDRGSLVPHLQD